jgi:hypothetical protein
VRRGLRRVRTIEVIGILRTKGACRSQGQEREARLVYATVQLPVGAGVHEDLSPRGGSRSRQIWRCSVDATFASLSHTSCCGTALALHCRAC